MCSGPLYKPANRGPGIHTGPALGASLSAIGLQWKIHEKIFCETTTAKASIFGIQHCYVELYINPAKHADGIRNGPTRGEGGSIAPLDLQLENHKKTSSPKPYDPELSYFSLLYKCCQQCPWGPYRPCPRHVIIYHRLIMEIHEKKIFSATALHKACIFYIQQCHVELYINPANYAPGVKYGPTTGVIIGP